MRYAFFIILFFCWQQTNIAQRPASLNVTVFNESNGIGNGRVAAMLQAKSGYLWFGTTTGLLCYDSYTFRLYNDSAITNTITRLAEDSSHCIWMSFLGGGLASFNPRTGAFKNYTVHSATDASLATSEVELLFFDSKGHLWLGIKQKGLIKADIGKNLFSVYNIVDDKNDFYAPAFRKDYNTLYDIHEEATGLFWLATHDGLYKFDMKTGQMTPVREKPLEKNRVRADLFGKIVSDGDTLWLSSWGSGVCAYNKKTNKWAKYLPDADTITHILKNVINSIAEKNNNEFWIPSPIKGLGVFNKTTKQFQFFNQDNLNSGNEVNNIISDKDGNLWGLKQIGLLKIQLPNYKFLYTPVPAKTHNTNFGINDIWEDDYFQLIATVYADGLHVLDKQNRKETVLPVEISPNEQEQEMHVRHIFKDSRYTFWIVTRDFIYQYDTARNKLVKIIQPPTYLSDKPSNSFTRVAEDKAGDMWFTTKRNGVFVYSVAEKKYTHYSNNKTDSTHYINATYLTDVATDVRGRVWLCSPFGFLGYVDPMTKKILQINSGEGIGLNLPVTQTNSLIADKRGNIWVGTYNGLYCFDCQASAPRLLKSFRAKDGLGSNFISDLIEDSAGNIWCNTGTGVSMVHYPDDRVSSYGTQDGIVEKDNLGIVKGTDTALRLTTVNGYYNLDYNRLKSKEKKISLVITRMTVNDKDFYFDEMLKEGKIKLTPAQNIFSFEFAAIDFNRSDNQHYDYILEGFDKDWIRNADRRFVNYTNIPGGNYIFKVRTFTDAHEVEATEIRVPLFIATPFYKTSFFYFFIAATFSGILFLFYRYRLNNQQEVYDLQSKTQSLEKEKALMMFEGLKQQLNPHFLFNSLTSLSGLIQTDPKMAGNFLDQMSKIYRYILKNRESTTVTLSEEIKFVTNYIQLQQTRFKQGLQVNINVDEDYEYRKISPVTLQNLIENAIKHNIVDPETPLMIDIFCEPDYLIVQNNLQKKDFVESSNRQGLVNMQSLYTYLTGKSIIIKEENDKFIIKIPLL